MINKENPRVKKIKIVKSPHILGLDTTLELWSIFYSINWKTFPLLTWETVYSPHSIISSSNSYVWAKQHWGETWETQTITVRIQLVAESGDGNLFHTHGLLEELEKPGV